MRMYYVCTYVRTYTCLFIAMHIRTSHGKYVDVYEYVYVYKNVYICVCIFICVCLCVCLHVYAYV